MTRGIVIAGNKSSLFSAFCAEAAKRVEKYAVAHIPHNQTVPPQKSTETKSIDDQRAANRQLVLEWNPSSPVSAKTLVLSGVNQMEHIDDAVLVCAPPAYRKNAENFSTAEIDSLIDNNIKGWFFLVRELTQAFTARKRGTLSLILPEVNSASDDAAPDFIGPAAAGAFRSLAQGILLSSLNAPYNAFGFSLPEPGEENAFAAFVFKTMEEGKKNSGKWYKYGKFSLFGR